MYNVPPKRVGFKKKMIAPNVCANPGNPERLAVNKRSCASVWVGARQAGGWEFRVRVRV